MNDTGPYGPLIYIIQSLCFSALSCKEIVSGKKGEIKTPNYPRNYDDNLDCTWTIQAEDDETVIIEFRDFHVETSLLPLKECADTFRVSTCT